MLPESFLNCPSSGVCARLPRLYNLRRDEDDDPDYARGDKHRLAPDEPRWAAQIEVTDRRHAVSADQNQATPPAVNIQSVNVTSRCA